MTGCDGASDAGARAGDVHPVWHRRQLGAQHLHEEPGRRTDQGEEQEAALRQQLSLKE